ncbi:Poly [ADP-ribose] polymerase 12 [Amphibalanus amphitrite]|uniref:Poly [ADP-ribose] polymerase 12 n=1 Tax=Amphibalanus amphitrite TaxID=1232801 RepID=A0A6A4WFN6_AMPAM|nr:Poly [ADP-ribose] polymerase 12 [Amphibalanus amphitrite]
MNPLNVFKRYRDSRKVLEYRTELFSSCCEVPSAWCRRNMSTACSESEDEGGAGPARRSHSMTPAGRRSLSTALSSLSISTSDLSGGGRPARAAPALCTRHRPPDVCRRHSCDALHICRLYVDGFCPHGDAACRWGHVVLSACNEAALAAHQLQALPERELLWLVRALMRQTAPVTAEEYRSQLVVCPEYAADARCRRSDCFRLHLCPRLAAGECGAGDCCRWSHRLTDPDNVMVLLRLRCSELSEAEVLARLAQNRVDSDTSDSAGSERGPTDTDSERESVYTDCEPTPPGRGAGAVGGNGATASGSHGQRTGAGRDQVNMDRSGSVSGAQQPSERDSDSSDQVKAPAPAPSARPGAESAGVNASSPTGSSGKELSKEEMIGIAKTLDVCHYYGFPSKCLDKQCGKLHLCRFYVADICPYAIMWCLRSHHVSDKHNKGVLEHHRLTKLPQAELVKALRAGYLARNPVTTLERRFLLQLCRPYQRGQCKFGEWKCTRLHICDGYMHAKCVSSSVCGMSHNLNSQHNANVVRNIGLHSMTARTMMEILNNPVPAKAMWESSAPKRNRNASSGTASGGSQPAAGGGQASAPDQTTAVSSATATGAAQTSGTSGSARPPGQTAGAVGSHSPRTAPAVSSPGSGEVQGREAATPTGGSLPVETARLATDATGGTGSRSATGTGSAHGSDAADGATRSGGSAQATGNASVQIKHVEGGVDQAAAQGKQTDKTQKAAEGRDAAMKSTGSDQQNPSNSAPSKTEGNSVSTNAKVRPPVNGQHTNSNGATKSEILNKSAPSNPKPKVPNKSLTKEDMARLAVNLDVCRDYFFPNTCKTKDCDKLHLCRFFIASKCTYAIHKCLRSHHLWSDPHNTRVLRENRLHGLSEQDVFRALRDGYLAQNPVTDAERRFLLQMCRPYQRGNCSRPEVCTRIHICDGYVYDKCESRTICHRSHDLKSGHNHNVVRGLMLESMTAADVKATLAKPVTAKEMWESSAPKGQRATSSAERGQVAGNGRQAAAAAPDRPPASGARGQNPPKQIRGQAVPVTSAFQREKSAVKPKQAVTTDSEDSDSDESIELPDDGATLCAEHVSSGRCQRDDCDGFHICGFYLANLCRRPDNKCPLGHSFGSPHNVRMMETYGLLGGSPEHFQELLDQMTLRARITFSNEAEERVLVCFPYSSTAGCTCDVCGDDDNACCGRFHLCSRFLSGSCTRADCERSHSLRDEHNVRVRQLMGLATAPGGRPRHAWATDRDIVEMLRAKLGVKPGVYDAPEEVPMPEPRGETTTDDAHLGAGRRCTDAACPAVHVCPHFLAGACRRQRCPLGHRLDTEPNRRALRLTGREVTQHNHDALLKELYKAAGNVQRYQLYDRLRICIAHNHVQGCRSRMCPYIHICQRFAGGTCQETTCRKGHSTRTEANTRKLRSLKLDTVAEEELLEMLRAIHGIRSTY